MSTTSPPNSPSDPDRLLKRVWLVIGFLVLAGGALGVAGMLVALLTDFGSRSDSVRAPVAGAPAASRPRAIRYDEPLAVRGTRTEIVLIRNGTAEQSRAMSASYSEYGESGGAIVNVVFVDSARPEGRLLLDRPAFIRSVGFAAAGAHNASADSLQPWITYEIALGDTNGDGALDRDDDRSLYVSALDGTGLRRVTPPGMDVLLQRMRPDRRSILVMALEPPAGRRVPPEERRQRAYLYDVPTGRLTPWTALEAPAARAARIVGR